MKKILSVVLMLAMVAGMLPNAVFAAENTADYELIPYEGMDFSDALQGAAFGDKFYYRELYDKIYSCCKLDSDEYALVELTTGDVIIKEVEHKGRKYIPVDVVMFDDGLNYLAYADAPQWGNYFASSTEGDAVIDKDGKVVTVFEEENVYRLFVLSKDVVMIYDNDLKKDRLKNIRTNQTVGITGSANVYNAQTFAKYGTYIKKADDKYYYVSPEGVISNTGISLNNCDIDVPLGENLWEISKDSMHGAIDRAGNVVIPVEYLRILPVGEDIYWVSTGDGIKYINSKNEVIQNPDIREDSDVYYNNSGEIRDAMTGELLLDGSAEGLECYVIGDNNDLIVAEKEDKWYRVMPKSDSQEPEITGVTLSDAEYTYDGTEKSVSISGTLPHGATVSYTNEKATDAGTYNVTAAVVADGYKSLVLSATLKINPAPITVTADSFGIKLGEDIPKLTYSVTSGTLVGDDTFTGTVATNANNNAEGTYKITQGTLALSANYDLTFVDGEIVVSLKTPQNITVSDVPAKFYGDEDFTIEVTPDEASGLDTFTFASSDENVATVSEEGVVTIVGAGEVTITVAQAGNEEYAAKEISVAFTVAQKEVTVEAINLDEQTATLVGVLEADLEAVEADFSKVALEIIPEEEPAEGEEPVVPTTATAKVTGLALKGDKAANYKLADAEIETTVSLENVVTVEIAATNGTATGGGTYLIGADVTVIATADEGYNFDGWYVEDEKVSEDAEYTFTADESIALEAKFTKKPSQTIGGGGGGGLAAGGDKSNAGADKLGDEDKTEAPEQTPVVTPSTPAGFADLGNYAWAADAITNLVEKGIIKGTSATTYSPANNIIRADFVALVVRMFNLTSENSENFADVNASDYFARELAIARNSGIVGGIGDNKFAPRGNITRQDMMVMLYRAMQKLDIQLTGTQTQNVSDLDTVSEYAKEAVETLMANGIINGKNGKIDPMASATRAEVAVMLNRVLDLVK